IAVEAKTSIMMTGKSSFSGHRNGILKQMVESLENYGTGINRFDLTVLRDNLEKFSFHPNEQIQIKKDIFPPGPENLINIGMATINTSTISGKDDIYILSKPCKTCFNYRSIIVADLSQLAKKSYELVLALKGLGGG
ncbi:hypothetical protein ACFLU2_02170, partial [Chloroflexota bacterium]